MIEFVNLLFKIMNDKNAVECLFSNKVDMWELVARDGDGVVVLQLEITKAEASYMIASLSKSQSAEKLKILL